MGRKRICEYGAEYENRGDGICVHRKNGHANGCKEERCKFEVFEVMLGEKAGKPQGLA